MSNEYLTPYEEQKLKLLKQQNNLTVLKMV